MTIISLVKNMTIKLIDVVMDVVNKNDVIPQTVTIT